MDAGAHRIDIAMSAGGADLIVVEDDGEGMDSADLAVAITGIAGPGGGSPGKPVGLVHFAGASRSGALTHAEMRYGDIGRSAVRHQSVLQALAMLKELAANHG